MVAEPKKRGRPPKKTEEPKKAIPESEMKNYNGLFSNGLLAYRKKVKGSDFVVERTIPNLTLEQLEQYLASPVTYSSQLINLNNFMYTYSSMVRNLVDFYVKPTYYRYNISTIAKNNSFLKVNSAQLQKNYMAFAARIEELNLKQELHRILIKMFLEDCVFGYWIEEGDSKFIYYLPSEWCGIDQTVNGLWTYYIDTSRVTQKIIDETLPKEIASIVKRYKGKSGEEGYARIPYEKTFCMKWNFHLQHIFPPMTSVLEGVLNIMRMQDVSFARYELSASNLISMELPIDAENVDSPLLSDTFTRQFVVAANEVLSENVGLLVSPMKITSHPLAENEASEKDIVRDAIDNFDSLQGVPSLGRADTAGELKRALEAAASLVFSILDQMSSVVNLKMKLDGMNSFPSYEFVYELLKMNEFNKVEFMDDLKKQADAGSPNKFRWLGAQNIPPAMAIGQATLENDVFKGMFESFTVLLSSHTQPGGSAGTSENIGRPRLPEGDLTEEGEKSRSNTE